MNNTRNAPTTQDLIKSINIFATVTSAAMENPKKDDDDVENDITVPIDFIHVSKMLSNLDIFFPDLIREKLPKIGKLRTDFDDAQRKDKKKKPKMYNEAEYHLNSLLINSHVSEITDDAKIFFAIILEAFDETNSIPSVVTPPVPADVPAVVVKKRGRPSKKVIT